MAHAPQCDAMNPLPPFSSGLTPPCVLPRVVPPPVRRDERGVVLVIALILLAVIGLSSAAAIRGSLFGDKVSGNLRASTTAMNAAELALRTCENAVRVGVWRLALPAGAPVPPPVWMPGQPQPGVDAVRIAAPVIDPQNWTVAGNWVPPAVGWAYVLPAAAMVNPNSGVQYPRRPECMVEGMTLLVRRGGNPNVRAFLVTARGFSPDYQQDGAGNPTAGSVVRLQSQILR